MVNYNYKYQIKMRKIQQIFKEILNKINKSSNRNKLLKINNNYNNNNLYNKIKFQKKTLIMLRISN